MASLTVKQTNLIIALIGVVLLVVSIFFLQGGITIHITTMFYVRLLLILIGIALIAIAAGYGRFRKKSS
ncbi:MAG: hypothetical protein M1454_01735 [Candidatus Thermoplasmatota archaeon]|nr:hypothetical protein [Candidatus Thermoplasmatota archaeon]MCL5730907.1 hypothetical protein [Candidatus Thermoplasmatota archaeon]